ncbi:MULTISPECIES: hypothetical protein [Moorena]|uniref:Uncharacterized protein n=1 Tax=Moorena producens (strain JHB) TaxID=1454205 RepID=A0A9Q9SU52_MOOP1|nr:MULTISPECIES: hypothetical protein [Moorena]WAN69668.1 hypothetical protein BJP36_36865 [Moorena producens JHB]
MTLAFRPRYANGHAKSDARYEPLRERKKQTLLSIRTYAFAP